MSFVYVQVGALVLAIFYLFVRDWGDRRAVARLIRGGRRGEATATPAFIAKRPGAPSTAATSRSMTVTVAEPAKPVVELVELPPRPVVKRIASQSAERAAVKPVAARSAEPVESVAARSVEPVAAPAPAAQPPKPAALPVITVKRATSATLRPAVTIPPPQAPSTSAPGERFGLGTGEFGLATDRRPALDPDTRPIVVRRSVRLRPRAESARGRERTASQPGIAPRSPAPTPIELPQAQPVRGAPRILTIAEQVMAFAEQAAALASSTQAPVEPSVELDPTPERSKSARARSLPRRARLCRSSRT